MTARAVRVSRAARFEAAAMEGGFLLYDGEELRLLQGTAALIFARVDGVRSAADIATALAKDFDESNTDVRDEAEAFLGHLAYMRVLDDIAAPSMPGYARPAWVGFVRDDAGGLLVHLLDGRRRRLTPTALEIWELVGTLRYAPVVAEALQKAHESTPEDLVEQVQGFLDELVSKDFLTRWAPG